MLSAAPLSESVVTSRWPEPQKPPSADRVCLRLARSSPRRQVAGSGLEFTDGVRRLLFDPVFVHGVRGKFQSVNGK